MTTNVSSVAVSVDLDPGYKDQRLGLVAFGVALMTLGVILGFGAIHSGNLFVITIDTLHWTAPYWGYAVMTLGKTLLAVLFLAMGLGSILGRRWSRALIFAASTGPTRPGAVWATRFCPSRSYFGLDATQIEYVKRRVSRYDCDRRKEHGAPRAACTFPKKT